MRRRTPARSLLLTALLVGVVAPALPAGSVAAAAPQVSATQLRIELTTTADWATVRLEGLSFPATRTLQAGPGDRVTFAGDAWTIVDQGTDGSRLVVDTVAADHTGRASFQIHLEQGRGGTTVVELHDDRRGSGPVLSLTTGDAASGVLNRSVEASRAEVLGSTELRLPHADRRRLVLAAYYPWFKRDGNPSSKMAEDPLQARSAWDLDDVRSHVAQARSSGIDGFAVSWAGVAQNGPQLDLVLRAMEEQGGVATPYLETASARGFLGGIDAAEVARWLDQAVVMADSPAFLRADDGVPIVMVFGMEKLSPATWQQMVADSAGRGRPVHLVGDADPATHGGAVAGWHRYGASGTGDQLTTLWRTMAQRIRGAHLLDPAVPNRLTLATVSPGYDDRRRRGSTNPVIPRGDGGSRYLETWAAATASDPDFILVTSWNEWFEGTAVEPGTVNGDLALRQTADRAAAWKTAAGGSPTAPTSPTTTLPPPPSPAPAPPPTCTAPWPFRLLCAPHEIGDQLAEIAKVAR